MSGSMSGMWRRGTVWIMRHRQTKGPDTDRPDLNNRVTSRLYWQVSVADIATVRGLLTAEQEHPWVKDRFERNLHYPKAEITQSYFWKVLVCMRATTMAASGEGSAIAKFEILNRFPLSLERVQGEPAEAREQLIHLVLGEHGVGTHRKKIASDLAWNLAKLEEDRWPALLEKSNSLLFPSEREVADFLASSLRGIGPKQARNILQDLGLTRFEIPIDSRVIKWLNACEVFPFTVTAVALSDRNYYHFILDAIQELCRECGTYPCVLDASIFSSLEKTEQQDG
jgi:hypothetical protein